MRLWFSRLCHKKTGNLKPTWRIQAAQDHIRDNTMMGWGSRPRFDNYLNVWKGGLLIKVGLGSRSRTRLSSRSLWRWHWRKGCSKWKTFNLGKEWVHFLSRWRRGSSKQGGEFNNCFLLLILSILIPVFSKRGWFGDLWRPKLRNLVQPWKERSPTLKMSRRTGWCLTSNQSQLDLEKYYQVKKADIFYFYNSLWSDMSTMNYKNWARKKLI